MPSQRLAHDKVDDDPAGWRREGQDLIRGIAAGAIVGIPLLYTMEMWWRGMTVRPGHLLALLLLTLLVNFVFCYLSGFRAEYSLAGAASESVTSVAVGLLVALAILALVGELRFDMHLSAVVGKVVIEAAPVSLGVSFANFQLRNRTRTGEEQESPPAPAPSRERAAHLQLKEDLNDVAATISGALIFSFNIAPTEEITMIATRLPAWQLLVVLFSSLALCYIILFAAQFQERTVHVPSLFQHPAAETAMTYALSLLVAFTLLYLVGEPANMSGLSSAVATTLVLGVPAVVGGSAGRLII